MSRRGIPFVISAPSGTGKTTVCLELIRRDPRLVFSVSHTTRAPREGEREGRDYHYVDPEVFDAMVAAGEFLEHAEYSGHLYGTAWSGLDQRLTAGCDALLEIETVGAAQIRRRGVGAFLIFLLPPSLDSLAERLRGRGTDGEVEVERRLRIAETEFRAAHHFDALVINRTVHETVVEVREIIAAVRAGTAARVTRERSCERLATLLPPPLDEWVQP